MLACDEEVADGEVGSIAVPKDCWVEIDDVEGMQTGLGRTWWCSEANTGTLALTSLNRALASFPSAARGAGCADTGLTRRLRFGVVEPSSSVSVSLPPGAFPRDKGLACGAMARYGDPATVLGRWKPGENVLGGGGASAGVATLMGLGRRGVVAPLGEEVLGTRL